MKRLFATLPLLIWSIICAAQTTYNPTVESKNNEGIIESVTLTEDETIVKIKYPQSNRFGAMVSISSATVLVPIDKWEITSAREARLSLNNFPRYTNNAAINQSLNELLAKIKALRKGLRELGWLIQSLGEHELDEQYDATKSDTYFTLHFDRLPVGVENVYIRELIENGWEWYGIKINNPYPTVENLNYDENTIKPIIEEQNDGIVGIYQGLTQGGIQYTLGCIKHNNSYKFVYLGSKQNLPHWKIGDVKAVLIPTATSTTYKLDWYKDDKTMNTDCYVIFDGAIMTVFINGKKNEYIKMFPTSSTSSYGGASSGTGFLLDTNGYIITNYHVIDGARTITVTGINDDNNIKYKAQVEICDKQNDIAIIRINSSLIL